MSCLPVVFFVSTHRCILRRCGVTSRAPSTAKTAMVVRNTVVAGCVLAAIHQACSCGGRPLSKLMERQPQHGEGHNDNTKRSEKQAPSTTSFHLCAGTRLRQPGNYDTSMHLRNHLGGAYTTSHKTDESNDCRNPNCLRDIRPPGKDHLTITKP